MKANKSRKQRQTKKAVRLQIIRGGVTYNKKNVWTTENDGDEDDEDVLKDAGDATMLS